MKKVLSVLLMGSLVAVFAGCGPRATNEGESDTTTMEAPAEEPMAPMQSDTTDTMSQDTATAQ